MALTNLRPVASSRARGITLILLVLVAFLTFAGSASANTNITSCGSVTGSGDYQYTLTANLTSGCEITGVTYAGAVIFDCNHHTISGNRPLYIHGNTSQIWVQNCDVYGPTTNTNDLDCNGGGRGMVIGTTTFHSGVRPVLANCYGALFSYVTFEDDSLSIATSATYTTVRYSGFTAGSAANIAVPLGISGNYTEVSHVSVDVSGEPVTDDGIVVWDGTTGVNIHDVTIVGAGDAGVEQVGSSSYLRLDNVSVTTTRYGGAGFGCFINCSIDHGTFAAVSLGGVGSSKPLFYLVGCNGCSLTNSYFGDSTGATTSTPTMIGSTTYPFSYIGSNTIINNHFSGSLTLQYYGYTDGGGNYCTSVTPWYTLTCH